MNRTSFFFQVGQQRRQVFRLFQHRAGSRAHVDAEFMRNDVRQRGFTQTGRAEQQHMVERLAALFRRTDENFQLLPRLGLADVVVKQLGPQRPLDRLFTWRGRRGRHHALGRRQVGHVEIVGLDAHGSPTLVTACTALPPEGAGLAWGSPPLQPLAPTLVSTRPALRSGEAVSCSG